MIDESMVCQLRNEIKTLKVNRLLIIITNKILTEVSVVKENKEKGKILKIKIIYLENKL